MKRYDTTFNFWTSFDLQTGLYIRSNVINEYGEDTMKDPFMAEFPHLLDIGIMGHCQHGLDGHCEFAHTSCYQSGPKLFKNNMPLDSYIKIMEECEGKVDQVALGGRGDPDCHEDFELILKATRKKGIIPNYTTSGYMMTKEKAQLSAKYCGAVAVSWYGKEYTFAAIDMLIEAGVKTNIHFVISNHTLDEAIELLEKKKYPEGINRIIFLLHKPVGLGSKKDMLKHNDIKVKQFYSLFDIPHFANIAGFDSCTVPALLNYCENLDANTMEPCEGARFSGYIDSELNFSPCSFDRSLRWAVNLSNQSIQAAWFSEIFENFRSRLSNNCKDCKKHDICLGGCPIVPEIVLCKDYY